MYEHHPLSEFPASMRYYYLCTLGYYVSKTFEDLFIGDKRNDFVEMLLHHILTIELYVGSYMTNYLAVGSLIILSLDWTQIFIGFSRAFSETKFKKITMFFGFSMWFTWIYFRCVVYPIVFYQGLYALPRQIPNFFKRLDEKFVADCLFGLCSGLHILNIWWGILITKIIIRAATKGSTKDLVNNVEE